MLIGQAEKKFCRVVKYWPINLVGKAALLERGISKCGI
jgi:hypothetical protein